MQKNCPTNHKNAVGGWSHTEYLIYCSDCGREISEAEAEKADEENRETLKEHVEGEVLHDKILELEHEQNESNN